MDLDLNDIPGALPVVLDFPRPQWYLVKEHIERECPAADREEAWNHVVESWLVSLREHLDWRYDVYEADPFLFLSAAEESATWSLIRLGERTLATVTSSLTELLSDVDVGKLVCLAFDDRDRYYGYISHFHEEGTYAGSGGMRIRTGYPHIVLNGTELDVLESTFVHELTHAILDQFRLPLWLEEGVVQILSDEVLHRSYFSLSRQDVREHQEYWGEHDLRSFWWGESFSSADDGQRLSYVLAEIVVRNMLSRGRDGFLEFLQKVRSFDAGDGAARDVYGAGLADFATHFLGDGDWEPHPESAGQFYFRAIEYHRHGEYEQAIAGFREAVQRAPGDAKKLMALAWLLCTCPDKAFRAGNEAVQLANRACEATRWDDESSLDALAAAYAAIGDFKSAVTWAEKALAMAPSEARPWHELVLCWYREGKPYQEDPQGSELWRPPPAGSSRTSPLQSTSNRIP